MLGNVAKCIMEGATIGSPTTELYGEYDYSQTMVGESSFLANACATLYTDIVESYQHYQTADVVATARLIQESKNGATITESTLTAVTEGVVRNTIDKIIASFKKFIAKIKEIYDKIIKWFKVMMADADKFVADYGDEVKKKAGKVKGYTYQGYTYKINNGNTAVEAAAKACSDEITKTLGGYDALKDSSRSKDDWKKEFGTGGSAAGVQADYDEDKDDNASPSEIVEDFMSKGNAFLGASDSTELRKELIHLYHDNATAKGSIKDFEGTSVTAMIKFLKESKKNLSDIEKVVTKYENKVNAVIKKLNGISVKDNDTDGSDAKLVSRINHISQIISQLLSLYRVPYDVKTQVYKEVTSEYLGALKGFVRYKGTSESTEILAEASLLGELPMACFEGKGSDDESGGENDEGDEKPVGESTNLLDDILNTVNAIY